MRRLLCVITLICIAGPNAGWAHAFGQRYDLPLPLGFYLAGAGLTVALTFLGSILFLSAEEGIRHSVSVRIPTRLSRIVGPLFRTMALLVLALIMATALFGPVPPTQNFSNIFVWVIWWVGFVLFTALVIDLWSSLNPFATIIDAILDCFQPRQNLIPPEWIDWLAVIGLIFLSWIELVSDWSESPRAMALLIALYTLGLFFGSIWFGRKAWFRSADPLTQLFSLLGRLAPISLRNNRLEIRLPTSGLIGHSMTVSQSVFVVTLIAIVLFDGISETPIWSAILQWITESHALRPWLLALREHGVDLLKLIRSIGLICTILIAWLLYTSLSLAIWWAAGRSISHTNIFTGFAASLLPIAVAYHLAHYVFFLALAGQLIVPALSDPFDLGWTLLGDNRGMIEVGIMTAEDVWWISIIALVTGHALSVLLAHIEAGRLFASRRQAVLSQLPTMLFMVTLTSFSLWVLSQPVVE
ncbi:hypothetical protein [Parasedimentitalea psychrophila]|uniref:Uncharacterized protein n=1 Tax=Parasedimentitalea psychrophila TaxID=2997337 RepID=A0A9Y2KVZ1_9RHOB|nr:hypothetical protein [Parasedimentitalea psychrophila]WIY23683.1 hypothetical protein QPJ95_13610 [Parasedimentitalea psychrophila]